MTAHNGIVYEPSKKSPFTRGLPYVAISRATDLDKVALLSPIRTDHFITDKFKGENDTITTFYKNLKIKFNTDEEIYNNKYSLNIIFTFNVLCTITI